jgi:hypothetical protein
MKLRNQLLIAIFALSSFAARAQDKEIGISISAANYQGDLTQKQVTLSETKPGLGLLARYYFGPRIDIKGSLNYGWISGSDQDYSNNLERQVRNLSFKSSIFELAGTVEFNILPYISNSKRYRFAPYIFGGAAFFHFNPKAEYNGQWYALQPLGTEGQNISGSGVAKYSLWQFAIPYGLGIKYSLGKFWNIGLEIGQRKLFTDYLDDVSNKFVNATDVMNAAPANAKDAAAVFANPSNNPVNAQDPKGHHYNPGQGRGDNTHLDMYVFTGITITKTIRRFSCTGF